MKVRALKKFETIKDLERGVIPKEGEVWETSEERAKFLLGHGVIEIVEEVKEDKVELKADSIKLDVKENVENITIEPSIILDGKKIAEQLTTKLNTITTKEALKDVIPADLEEKPKKTTKKKISKK